MAVSSLWYEKKSALRPPKITLYNVCAVPLGAAQYREGYHDACGKSLEYRGGVQYRGGYHEYRGGYHDARRGWGIMSTVGCSIP